MDEEIGGGSGMNTRMEQHHPESSFPAAVGSGGNPFDNIDTAGGIYDDDEVIGSAAARKYLFISEVNCCEIKLNSLIS